MVTRVEVYTKVVDARARAKIKQIENDGFAGKIKDLIYVDVYTIEKDFSEKELIEIAERLANPVTQDFVIRHSGKRSASRIDSGVTPFPGIRFDLAVEIGFLPGVTDNVANTTKQLIQDLLKVKFSGDENVYSSQLNLIFGKVSTRDGQKIGESIANTLIQRIHYKDFDQYERSSSSNKTERGMDLIVPKVSLNKVQQVLEVDLNVSDEVLQKIGKEGILDPSGVRQGPLALSLEYMKTIQSHFKKLKRNPTDVELETLAQTWSEHCKHTIFADPLDEVKDGLFKTFIKRATEDIIKKKKGFAAKVFNDNSGALHFDDQYFLTHKVETHNSPSALDPFGGSITGIVGVNRDALGFGLGAKPIFNTYGFMFAPPEEDSPLYRRSNKQDPLLPPRRIMEGVIAGVNAGGNQSGIPTPQGFLYFDKSYKGKPLVFCGTVGLIPKKIGKRDSRNKKAEPDDYIVMVGGRVGIDGIHGATFSSESLTSGSPATAVQIGDPITQKKFSDAIVREVRDLNLYSSITDIGGGGLSSSVGEMAKESGGCEVWLEKVPLKYPGLEPWQIWISESQERMTFAVPKKNWEKFKSLMDSREIEATIIGKYTNSCRCILKYEGKVVLDLEMDFMHEGLPKRVQRSAHRVQKFSEPRIKEQKDLTKVFIDMVGRLNTCGYDFLSTQYDHTVQGLAVTYPVQGRGRVNSEFAVMRPKLSSDEGIVLSQGMYPHYSEIDTYNMAAASIDTAFKNTIIAGANPEKIALLDNFCWCSSDDSERLGQLKRACQACYDYAVEYGAPFISGKDSMFNDFKGFDEKGSPIKISILPTLLISTIGIIEDVKKAITLDFKMSGDLIYVLGETFDELGASEYFRYLGDAIGNKVPKIDAKKNLKLYKAYAKAVEKGLVSSGNGINLGGLGVALAKSSGAGNLGFEVSLKNIPGKVSRDDFALYSESQGRILVTIDPAKKNQFEKIVKGNPFREIGKVRNDNKIEIDGLNGREIVNTTTNKVLVSYKERFKDW